MSLLTNQTAQRVSYLFCFCSVFNRSKRAESPNQFSPVANPPKGGAPWVNL